MAKIKRILIIFTLILLVYTRFININWGLPNPFHPDERNMAIAIAGLTCEIQNSKPALPAGRFKIQNCLNPRFFAYGQPPLYVAFGLIKMSRLLSGATGPISLEEAIVTLRLISAICSILAALILVKIIELFFPKDDWSVIVSLLLFTFSPFFIQFSHFGTTESLLMFLYAAIVYIALFFAKEKMQLKRFITLTSIIAGVAIATKISSVLFLLVPIYLLVHRRGGIIRKLFYVSIFVSLVAVITIIFSPHNIISFLEFSGSMKYESEVGLGLNIPFYTRQFEHTLPIIFQLVKIFPYALGLPMFLLFIGGFFFLPYTNANNLLRLAFVGVFLPNAFLYAKWTRFMVPSLTIAQLIGVIIFLKLRSRSNALLFYPLFFLVIIPGIAFLSIYQNEEVRAVASRYMVKKIPSKSLILSETANVVDIPIAASDLRNISFNFYELDREVSLQKELSSHLINADYIIVPSRRIIYNHTCLNWSLGFTKNRCRDLKLRYPRLDDYYDKLINGGLGFQKIAQFSSHPKISLFGKALYEVDDENAEETFTVFDHPVIRIYKRI